MLLMKPQSAFLFYILCLAVMTDVPEEQAETNREAICYQSFSSTQFLN